MSESKNTQLHLVKAEVHRRQFLTTALIGTAAATAPSLQVLKSSRLRSSPPQSSSLPPKLVHKAMGLLLRKELGNFAGNLETARTLWRRCPALVEAPVFPEQLRAAFVAEWEREPSDDCELDGEPMITDEVREKNRPHAEDIARGWAASGPRSAS
jgi:hypothetical protein